MWQRFGKGYFDIKSISPTNLDTQLHYKNMTCIKGKIIFNIVVPIITIIFIAYSSFFLLNCMVEYKYHIEENFDQANLYLTYSDQKRELLGVMFYLKISLVYSILVLFGAQIKRQ